MSTQVKKNTFSEKFLRLFPSPVFLQMHSVGLDITDSSVRFLGLQKTKNGKEVKKFGSYKIPENVIINGKIKNKEELAKVLHQIKKDHNINFVNVSLPEEQAYLFQTKIKLDKTKRKQLRNVLEFKLEENVPVSSRELVFDFEPIDYKKGKKDIDMSVAAFPVRMIAEYISALNMAGLTPKSFEIEAQSIARSVIPKGDMGTYMIVDFGKIRTGISIVSGEILRFTSTVDVGGNTLSKAVQKYFNVGPEEADKIKNEKGFARYKENEELLEILMSTVSVLKDEINKHYLYWSSRTDQHGESKTIDKIILCGGSSNLAGLAEYLSLSIDIPVDIANVWTNNFSIDEVVPEIEFRFSLSYAASIGLALRDFS